MTEIVLFHHAQGQTEGFIGFADELRAAGHSVHTPDYFDGRTFTSVEEAVGYRDEVGQEELMRRAAAAVGVLPPEALGSTWPAGLPAQVHGMADDPWTDWDAEVAPFAEASAAEVFRCPGTRHLFGDVGNADSASDAAGLLRERVLAFASRVG